MKRLFVLLLASLFVFEANAQAEKDLVDNSVTTRKLEADMRFIASDELRGRDTGSPEIKIASAFIANRFSALGVQPGMEDGSYFQSVSLTREVPPSKSVLSFNGKELSHGKEIIIMKGQDGDYKSEFIYLNYGLEEDYKKVDVSDKMVVVKFGDESGDVRQGIGMSGTKVKLAQDAGASGIIELYKSSQVPWSLIVNYMGRESISLNENADEKEISIPLVYMNDPEGEMNESLQKKGIEATLTIEGKVSEAFNGRNVVGIIEGTDPVLKNQFIALTAHYDHVGVNKSAAPGEDNIYNGARDNGMGTVSILAAAEAMSKNPPKRSVLLVAFTGEEKGLLGSRWFVDHSPVELSQIIYNFNVDNAGYSDTSIVTIFGMGRTTADPLIQKAVQAYGLEAIPDPAPEQNLFDRSDNVNFARVGIPAPTYSGGFKAFDDKINKFYHQVTDGPDTIDYEYLTSYTKAYILGAYLIANNAERPFWIEGDKYEEAGKILYGIETK